MCYQWRNKSLLNFQCTDGPRIMINGCHLTADIVNSQLPLICFIIFSSGISMGLSIFFFSRTVRFYTAEKISTSTFMSLTNTTKHT